MTRSPNRDLDTEELFRLYAPFVARFLYRLGVRSEGLDDLVQDVFLVAHRNGGYRAGPAKPTSYLATIAHNAALAHRRKERTRRTRHVDLDVDALVGMEDVLAKGKSPVQVLETNDSLRLLEAALDRLDPTLRTTLVLVEIEGESCTSVAAAMGIPVGTVYFRLHQARKKFQAALKVAETKQLRVVRPLPPLQPLHPLHPEDAREDRRAKVGLALGANLLWQKSGAHGLLRLGYEQPPVAYDTLAALAQHRALASSAVPTPEWASAIPSAPGAVLGVGAGGVAVAGAAIAAAVWLSAASPGPVAAHDAAPIPRDAVALGTTPAPPPAPVATTAPAPTVVSPPAASAAATSVGAAAGSTASREVGSTAGGRTPSSAPDAHRAALGPPSRTSPAPSVREVARKENDDREDDREAPSAGSSPGDAARLEALQVAQAERLLASDPARALAAARSAAVRFPSGFLREERAYVEIAALSRLGRKDEARAAAERFLRAYPGGAFAARVRRATEP